MSPKEPLANFSEVFDRTVARIIAMEESDPYIANYRGHGRDGLYFRRVFRDEETGEAYIRTVLIDDELGFLDVSILGNGDVDIELDYVDKGGRDDSEQLFYCHLDAIDTVGEGIVSIGDAACSLSLRQLPLDEALNSVENYGLGITVVSIDASWIIPQYREALVELINQGFADSDFLEPEL